MEQESHQEALREELGALVRQARELLLWEIAADVPGVPIAARSTDNRPLEPRPTTPDPATTPDLAPAPTPTREPEPTAGRAKPSTEDRGRALLVVAEQAASCTKCGLHRTRTKSVFSRGSVQADVVFIGEGPGFHEDQRGEPFVGPAGQLLDRMVVAMGLARDDVYVCNIVKCRPPENRTPLPNEAAACASFLEAQLETVAPRVIVALGRCATENLGCVEPGQKRWRGVWKAWRAVPVMPTYHPAFLLRSPEFKRPVWEDLQQVMAKLRS